VEDRRVRADLIEVFKMFRALSYTFLIGQRQIHSYSRP